MIIYSYNSTILLKIMFQTNFLCIYYTNSKFAVKPLKIYIQVNSSVVAFGINVNKCFNILSIILHPIATANNLLYLSSIDDLYFDNKYNP